MDKAQHSAGSDFLHSIQLGDLPGIGMTIIDGIVRTGRSRNTPPATKVPEVVPALQARTGLGFLRSNDGQNRRLARP